MGDTRVHVAREPLHQGRRIGGGRGPRRGGLRRPVPGLLPGGARPVLVARRKGLREPYPSRRDPARGGACVHNRRAVVCHGEARASGRVPGVAAGVGVQRGAYLVSLDRCEAVGVGLGIGERDVARRALLGRRGRRFLAHREHRGRERGGPAHPVSQGGGEERHRHREVAGHDRHVRRHRLNPRLSDERHPDVAARHQGSRAHALRGLAHGDAVEDGVKRPPALEPDEPGEVGTEDRSARRREHEQHRHGKGADIEALEHDAEHRHPGLGLAADGPVGRDGLGLGPGLGVGPQGGGVAGLRGPLLAGVVYGVQHHLLAQDLRRASGGPDQVGVGCGERGHELGPGQRLGLRSGEDPPPEDAGRPRDLGPPERVQARGRLGAGDDLAVHRSRAGAGRSAAGRVLDHPRGRRPGGRRARGGDEPPDVGALPEIVRRDVPQEQSVEHALPRVGAEVPGEHRVGHFHAGGLGR